MKDVSGEPVAHFGLKMASQEIWDSSFDSDSGADQAIDSAYVKHVRYLKGRSCSSCWLPE